MISDCSRNDPFFKSALSVAPMMAWTDRHCRFFHRTLSKTAILYTEMVTSRAIIYGDAQRFLDRYGDDTSCVLQLGGNVPDELENAAKSAQQFGWTHLNLNVGCPSDRVQSGCFGAILMKDPQLVADCVTAMGVSGIKDVSVKCRIGVDDDVPSEVLPEFLDHMVRAGVKNVIIHARKAWLKGLSPKENRTIPPLDYDLVFQMASAFPDLNIEINGGIETIDQVRLPIEKGLPSVMVGRAAYHKPGTILPFVDTGFDEDIPDLHGLIFASLKAMQAYIAGHLKNGGVMHQVTRHMHGIFHGMPGAAHWRRTLSSLTGDAVTDMRIFGELLDHMEQTTRNASLESVA